MKTAMQELKDKIQHEIEELNGELNEYKAGYKQCLINIQNDIDCECEQEKANIKYEIHIGEIFDLTTNSKKPKNIIIINQDQLEVIEKFSNQRKDAELNTIYIINDCEFYIFPHFDFGVDKTFKSE